MVGRTSIMAIIGGTFAKLGGGKFANGAMSAAFVHLFNDEFDYLYLRGKGVARAMGGDGKTGDSVAIKNAEQFASETKGGLIKGLKNVKTISSVGAWSSGVTGQYEVTVFFVATAYIADQGIYLLGGQDSIAVYRHGLIDIETAGLPNYPIPARTVTRAYLKYRLDKDAK